MQIVRPYYITVPSYSSQQQSYISYPFVTTYSDAKFTTLGKGKVSQLLNGRFITSPFEQYQQYSDIGKTWKSTLIVNVEIHKHVCNLFKVSQLNATKKNDRQSAYQLNTVFGSS